MPGAPPATERVVKSSKKGRTIKYPSTRSPINPIFLKAKKAKLAAMWKGREETVTSFLKDNKERWIATPEISKAVKMNKLATREVLNRLIGAKTVKREGAGPHAKYKLA